MDFETGHNQEFSSVTQCPYCDTAFHVGLSQLDAADGRVRCGGCLRVFNAKEHFLVEQKRLFDDHPEDHQDPVPQDQPQVSGDSDPFSVDLLGAEIIDEEGPIILGDFDHYSGASIPRDAILKEEVDEFRQQDYEPASAHDVLGDFEAAQDSETSQDSSPSQDAEPAQHKDSEQGPESLQETKSPQGSELIEDLQLLEAEFDPEQLFDETANPVDQESPERQPEPEQAEAEAEAEKDNQGIEEEQFLYDYSGGPDNPYATADTLDPIAKVEPEAEFASAIEVESEDPKSKDLADQNQSVHSEFFIGPSNQSKDRNKPMGMIWLTGLCLLILALPVQLIYRQPAELVEKPWFRQLAANTCPYIGCDIPVYINIEAIRISGFIEPHNQYQNSLVAKIDLRNMAVSEQPFPAIAIFFRNLNGRITASREFQPRDYLRGEARAYKAMPIDRNIQLELEFLDPGEQSTSYELFVRESSTL